jgi:hypothetical protein
LFTQPELTGVLYVIVPVPLLAVLDATNIESPSALVAILVNWSVLLTEDISCALQPVQTV